MIRLHEVTRSFSAGEATVHALDGVSLEIPAQEFVAIMGPSGCGKSTLLNLLGGLDRPTSGEVVVDGIALHRADERTLTRYRRHHLGIVFQFFNLLPSMTVLENVELPLLLQGVRAEEARSRARETLDLVGLSDRETHFPHQMSGGQMQRASIARALIHRPAMLLADEPTGNLDSENAERVLDTLSKIASLALATMVIVTHSTQVAELASRRVEMLDGKITAIIDGKA